MGQKQFLLIILGMIVVGIAILVGLGISRGEHTQAVKDAMTNDLNIIAADAIGYRNRAATMGGGFGSFSGYTIPSKFAATANGRYLAAVGGSNITLNGVSAMSSTNTITVVVDTDGRLSSWTYGGDFE